MDRSSRRRALILAAALLAAIVFSSAFMVARAEHDCASGECFICRVVALCENTLRAAAWAALVPAAVSVCRRVLCRTLPAAPACRRERSLIALKVKLSD